jgi:hypothetical protein
MTKCIELTDDLPATPLLAGDTAKVLDALTLNEVPMGKQSENSVNSED